MSFIALSLTKLRYNNSADCLLIDLIVAGVEADGKISPFGEGFGSTAKAGGNSSSSLFQSSSPA